MVDECCEGSLGSPGGSWLGGGSAFGGSPEESGSPEEGGSGSWGSFPTPLGGGVLDAAGCATTEAGAALTGGSRGLVCTGAIAEAGDNVRGGS